VNLIRVDREVDALDDLGAVLEGDVQVLELEQCQLREAPFIDFKGKMPLFVTA
jgi:hypothetical protein